MAGDLITQWSLDSRAFVENLRKTEAQVKRATVSADRDLNTFARTLSTRAFAGVGGAFTLVRAFGAVRDAIAEARAEVPEMGREVARLEDRWDRLGDRVGRGLLTALNGVADPIANLVGGADDLLVQWQREAGAFALRQLGMPRGAADLIARQPEREQRQLDLQRELDPLQRRRASINVSGSRDEADRIEGERIRAEQRDAMRALKNRSLPPDFERAIGGEIDAIAKASLDALANRRRQAEEDAQRRRFEDFTRDATTYRDNIRRERDTRQRLADFQLTDRAGFEGRSREAYGLNVLPEVGPDQSRVNERNELLEELADIGRNQARLLERIAVGAGGLAP